LNPRSTSATTSADGSTALSRFRRPSSAPLMIQLKLLSNERDRRKQIRIEAIRQTQT